MADDHVTVFDAAHVRLGHADLQLGQRCRVCRRPGRSARSYGSRRSWRTQPRSPRSAELPEPLIAITHIAGLCEVAELLGEDAVVTDVVRIGRDGGHRNRSAP